MIIMSKTYTPELPPEVLDRLEQFVRDNAKEPLLQERGPDVGKALVKLLVDYADRGDSCDWANWLHARLIK